MIKTTAGPAPATIPTNQIIFFHFKQNVWFTVSVCVNHEVAFTKPRLTKSPMGGKCPAEPSAADESRPIKPALVFDFRKRGSVGVGWVF